MSYYKSYLDKKNAAQPLPVANTPATPIASTSTTTATNVSKWHSLLSPWAISSAVAVLAVIIGSALFYNLYTAQRKVVDGVLGTNNENQNNQLIGEVAKMFLFPAGETPTIANVTDVEKLRISQPFFNIAQNGDKLLIFTNKIVLYRPTTKQIVDTVNRGTEVSPTLAP